MLLRTSLRSLRNNKSFSIINIIGLSVGMAVAVLIFLWVDNERNFDNYHKRSENIYRFTSHLTKSDWVWDTSPFLFAEAAKREVPEIEKITRFCFAQSTFDLKGQLFLEKKGAYVDNQWFDMFHYDFIYGNATAFNKNPFSIILTNSVSKKLFGNKNPVGEVIRRDSADYVVQGVVSDTRSNSSFLFQVMMPLEAKMTNARSRRSDSSWGNFNYQTFALLQQHADPLKVEKKLTQVLATNKKSDDIVVTLNPISSIHFETDITNGSQIPHMNEKVVYVFSVFGFVLLIIACINYINLTTGKSSIRAKEVSIKKIIGARKWNLMAQFLTDSLLISIISVILSIGIIYLLLPAFSKITERNFTNALNEFNTWKILIGTLVGTTILNGIYPAFLLSSFKPLDVFRGLTVLKVKDVYFRKSLVVVQFALSVAMIIGTIVIFQQLRFIQEKNLGYSYSQVMKFNFPFKVLRNYTMESQAGFLRSIKTELQSGSFVKDVSLSSESVVEVGSSSSGGADWEGRDTTFNPTLYRVSADVDYKDVFQLQMKEGRWFQLGNKADYRNVILNETGARELNLKQPYVGQRFTFSGDTGQVIGIVKDFHFKSLHEKIEPIVMKTDEVPGFTFFLKLHPGKNAEAIAFAEKIWKKYAPGEAFDYSFEDENFNNLYKQDQRISSIILSFAVLAILISIMGLFGLSAFAIDQRKKEIGIRKVLGASVANIFTLLSKDFLKLVIAGIIIASPVAWWMMHKWLEEFAYRINLSVWFFIKAGLLSLAIAIITICSQGFRTVRANPVDALRTE